MHWVVKYRPWYEWKNVIGREVPFGWYDVFEAYSTPFDMDFRSSVSEADDPYDQYTMCTAWMN